MHIKNAKLTITAHCDSGSFTEEVQMKVVKTLGIVEVGDLERYLSFMHVSSKKKACECVTLRTSRVDRLIYSIFFGLCDPDRLPRCLPPLLGRNLLNS